MDIDHLISGLFVLIAVRTVVPLKSIIIVEVCVSHATTFCTKRNNDEKSNMCLFGSILVYNNQAASHSLKLVQAA